MKITQSDAPATAPRRAAASHDKAADRSGRGWAPVQRQHLPQGLQLSPRSLAQRADIDGAFGAAQQRPGVLHGGGAPLRPLTVARPVAQRVTALEAKVGELLGVAEGDVGWEIAEDVAGWFDTGEAEAMLKPDAIDIEQQQLIKKVCVAQGYHESNANRLATRHKYQRDDIYGQTRVKRSGFSLHIREDLAPHDTQQVHSFPEDDLTSSDIRHQIYFRFLYSKKRDGDWGELISQDYIARNPLLANFNATDVIHEQLRFINNIDADYEEFQGPFGPAYFQFERLHISDIINTDFLPWWQSQALDLEDGYHALDEDVMNSFLTEISNGRLVKRVADQAEKVVVSGGIRIYNGTRGRQFDLDFALEDKPEPELEDPEQQQDADGAKQETQ